LVDQLPRNVHRGTPLAFAFDAKAREVARAALARGHHSALPERVRLFLYLPFEHSEDPADQARAVELCRQPGGEALRGPEVLRAVIRRFDRFPYRNAILGRPNTPAEVAFLEEPGSPFFRKRCACPTAGVATRTPDSWREWPNEADPELLEPEPAEPRGERGAVNLSSTFSTQNGRRDVRRSRVRSPRVRREPARSRHPRGASRPASRPIGGGPAGRVVLANRSDARRRGMAGPAFRPAGRLFRRAGPGCRPPAASAPDRG
jgi:hypothetical protein